VNIFRGLREAGREIRYRQYGEWMKIFREGESIQSVGLVGDMYSL